MRLRTRVAGLGLRVSDEVIGAGEARVLRNLIPGCPQKTVDLGSHHWCCAVISQQEPTVKFLVSAGQPLENVRRRISSFGLPLSLPS